MLVNNYSKRIFNLAYQFSGSFEAAEDLTQDIFLKLYHTLPKFDLNKNFDAWLLTLSRNYLIDQYRKRKLEKTTRDEFDEHFLVSDTYKGPEDGFMERENKNKVWKGFAHLSPELRMAVILKDIQGKKYDEIAEIMSIPPGTVKSRVSRARLQLAKILKEKKENNNG